MGLNFRKSISLGHGMKVNLSKSGPSLSFGKKGLRQTISATGRSTTTVGIPGTGVYYSKQTNVKKLASGIGGLFGGKKAAEAEEKAAKKGAKTTKADSKADAKAKEEKAAALAAEKEQARLEKEKAKEEARLEKEKALQEKEEAKQALIAEGQEKIEKYEAYVDSIKSVHKICDDQIDWEGISRDELPAGVKVGTDEYEEWKVLNRFALDVVAGNMDAYLEVIEQMKPFDDLLDYGSEFEYGTEDGETVSVEFRVKPNLVVPDYTLSLLASGEVSEKPMAKTAFYDLTQDYVCSTVIRIARDTFALLPVDSCKVYAVDTVLNPATGNDEEVTILAVDINRDALSNINMDRIDPSDALTALGAKMNFKKSAGFAAID